MKQLIITIAICLLSTIGYSQEVHKFRAYERIIIEPNGSKERTPVNDLIVLDLKEDKITAYIKGSPIQLDIIKYLDSDKENLSGYFIAIDNGGNKVTVSLRFLDYPESLIVFDYSNIKGGAICFNMRDTK